MRNPRHAIAKLPRWQTWGEAANRKLDEVADGLPDFDRLATAIGTDMTAEEAAAAQDILEAIGSRAAQALGELTGCQMWDVKGPTGWRWRLVEAITAQTQDPDTDISHWLSGYTPLGISCPIAPKGIFPKGDTTKAQEASAEYLAALNGNGKIERNYSSFHEQEKESQTELDRLIQAGHLEPLGTWDEVQAIWPDAKATKLATLVKTRADGTAKVRFIADMRRSGVNGMVHIKEKIVLPRGSDLIKDALDLVEQGAAEVELYTADFTDAFLNLPIDPEEKQYAVIMAKPGRYCAYRGVPFGLASAPLVWGRMAAWLGRAAQALHPPGQHRLQIYVDDPAAVIQGSQSQRDRIISKTLVLWAALGARIALHKASRGRCIKWIGANYAIIHGGVQVSIDAERIQKLQHVVEAALNQKGMVQGMRSLAGELSWVAGLIPTIRPFVNMVWAAVYGMDKQSTKVRTGTSAARHRPAGLVFAKTIKLPMLWMQKFLQGHHGGLQRVRWVMDRYSRPQWILRTDASTTGMGGILLDHQARPVRWWAAPLPDSILQQIQVPTGEPGYMTVYELLALLTSIHTWRRLLSKCRLSILAQLDSESALRVAIKLASPHPAVNRLAAELALALENIGAEALTGQHWRNVVNIEADALSRLSEGKEVPLRLRHLPRDRAANIPLRLAIAP